MEIINRELLDLYQKDSDLNLSIKSNIVENDLKLLPVGKRRPAFKLIGKLAEKSKQTE